jgi:hypothetical protein
MDGCANSLKLRCDPFVFYLVRQEFQLVNLVRQEFTAETDTRTSRSWFKPFIFTKLQVYVL